MCYQSQDPDVFFVPDPSFISNHLNFPISSVEYLVESIIVRNSNEFPLKRAGKILQDTKNTIIKSYLAEAQRLTNYINIIFP